MIGDPDRCRRVLPRLSGARPGPVPDQYAQLLAQRRLKHLRDHPQGGAITRRFESIGGLTVR